MQKIVASTLAALLSAAPILAPGSLYAEESGRFRTAYQSALELSKHLQTPSQEPQQPQDPKGQNPLPTPIPQIPTPVPQIPTPVPSDPEAAKSNAVPPGAVRLRVAVLEQKKGGRFRFRRSLEKNLRVYEDGVEQTIQVQQLDDEPVTIAFLFEWRSIVPQFLIVNYQMWYEYLAIFQQILNDVAGFMQELNQNPDTDKPKDMAAIVAYNDWKKPDCDHLCSKVEKKCAKISDKNADKKHACIETLNLCKEKKVLQCQEDSEQMFKFKWVADFTTDQDEAVNKLNNMARMYIPYSSEADLNDTLNEVVDRMKDYKGLKTIVIVGTGIDTFSSTFRNDMLKKIVKSNIQIFTIGTGIVLDAWWDYWWTRITGKPADDTTSTMDFVFNIPRTSDFALGDAYLKQISKITGGRHYQPRDLQNEMATAFDNMFTLARNEYLITYVPKNPASPKKLDVKLVDVDDQGKLILDKKGHPKEPELKSRDGKKAKIVVDYPEGRSSVDELNGNDTTENTHGDNPGQQPKN